MRAGDIEVGSDIAVDGCGRFGWGSSVEVRAGGAVRFGAEDDGW